MTKLNFADFEPTTKWAIKMLESGGNGYDGSLYMETGKYKPWSMPVITALRRRGFRVDTLSPSTFLVHPKAQ
jgi:hypothetical protein